MVYGKILDMAVSLIQVLGNETLAVSEGTEYSQLQRQYVVRILPSRGARPERSGTTDPLLREQSSGSGKQHGRVHCV